MSAWGRTATDEDQAAGVQIPRSETGHLRPPGRPHRPAGADLVAVTQHLERLRTPRHPADCTLDGFPRTPSRAPQPSAHRGVWLVRHGVTGEQGGSRALDRTSILNPAGPRARQLGPSQLRQVPRPRPVVGDCEHRRDVRSRALATSALAPGTGRQPEGEPLKTWDARRDV